MSNVSAVNDGPIRKPVLVGKNTIYPVRELIAERAVRCYACSTNLVLIFHGHPIKAAYHSSGNENQSAVCHVSHEHCSTKQHDLQHDELK